MKFLNSHLSTEQIADAIDNRLAASDRGSFEAHLESCRHCAFEYKTLARSINLMRSDRTADAPPEALNFARNIFRARKQFVSPAESLPKRILASLKLNVSPFSPVFGERSAGASAERQMFFEAGDFDLDLRIRRRENDFELAGQILGELPEQISIRLQNADYSLAATAFEQGEFKIEYVPAGIYNLTLSIGETEIEVSDLAIE